MPQYFKDYLLLEYIQQHLTLEQYWQLIKLIIKQEINNL